MNSSVKLKLIHAIIKVKRGQSTDHVLNKKGQAFLAVRKAPSGLIVVTDKKGRNVKNHLISWKDTRSFHNFIQNNLSNLYGV
jgi:hypothetical protein